VLSHPFLELDHHLGIRRGHFGCRRDETLGAEECEHVLDTLPQRLPVRLRAFGLLHEVRRQAIVDILELVAATIEPLAESARPADQGTDRVRGIPTRGQPRGKGIDVRAEQSLAVATQTVWSLEQHFDHRSVLLVEG
jgi:hypothetical protein